MKVHETHIPGVLIFEPQKYGDSRGYFFESYNMKVFEKATGKKNRFRSRQPILFEKKCH